MPGGNTFGNISLAHHLTITVLRCSPRVANQEGGRLLGNRMNGPAKVPFNI